MSYEVKKRIFFTKWYMCFSPLTVTAARIISVTMCVKLLQAWTYMVERTTLPHGEILSIFKTTG